MQQRLTFIQANMEQQETALVDLKNSSNELLERTT